ncbi:MAG TPA: hypothetical protein VGF78_09740 [Candidatus Dormibacteraeota bacterium]|jgi:hypothetical protein
MSINPEYDGTVTLRPYPNGAESEPVAAVAVDQAPPAAPAELSAPAQAIEPAYLPEPPRFDVPAAVVVTARSSRPRWVAPVAIGAVGIIASGSLGYLLWSTTGQRDAARHQLASTQVLLTSTQDGLSTAQSQAAARQLTADYVSLYVADAARVLTDDESMNTCKGYSQCRTAAQQTLNDMQAFQSDRTKATVPAALANSDAMLGDALSAGIAAVQEVIGGMDNNNFAKIKDGWSKLDKSMLSIGKAETALGAGLK